MKYIFFLVSILLLITCCTPGNTYRNSEKAEVIYHVFQRSFYDSDGDGHGDLNGLREKLGYLQDLGITSILLMPLYEAECYHNYFATDFEKIDPEFGTMEDYLALVKEVHRRGMKIYMDMETQYVTSDHLWWKEAVGNPGNPYSEYLLFEDEEQKIPATIVFDLRALNSFDGKVIDITTVNLRSPKVLEYNIKLFKYFMDPNGDGNFDDGVDGFRLDHAMDNLDNKPELTDLFEHFWNPLISELKALNPDICIIAEQADWADPGFEYLEKAGVDRVFGFGIWYGILTFDKEKLSKIAESLFPKLPNGKDIVVFLENHDIDRLTETVTGPEKRELAASLLFTLGGIPSIYYGQEIGMKGKGGNFGPTDGNDIPRREAFEWYSDTTGIGMATWYKNSGPWWDSTNLRAYDGISLEEQMDDPKSNLEWYKTLIEFRNEHPAIHKGSFRVLENDNPAVFTYVREFKNEKIMLMANLSAASQQINFSEDVQIGAAILDGFVQQGNSIQLAPYHFCAVRVK